MVTTRTRQVPRPPLADAVGYTVDVKTTLGTLRAAPSAGAAAAAEVGVYSGKVTAVHEGTARLCVQYVADGAAAGEADQEWLDYFSEDVAWMAAPATLYSRSRVARPPLAGAAGYVVEVRASTGDVAPGEVVSVDVDSQTIRVRCVPPRPAPTKPPHTQTQTQPHTPTKTSPRRAAAAEEEYVLLPHLSLDVAWMDPPTAFAAKSAVPRPALVDALGYSVDVKHAIVPGSSEYEAYVGVVTRVDVKARSVLILFEGALACPPACCTPRRVVAPLMSHGSCNLRRVVTTALGEDGAEADEEVRPLLYPVRLPG